jgi:hypothetical protein
MYRRRSEAERDPLETENERLRQENTKLRETFDHLHRSAQLWAGLYERQLARANELAGGDLVVHPPRNGTDHR